MREYEFLSVVWRNFFTAVAHPTLHDYVDVIGLGQLKKQSTEILKAVDRNFGLGQLKTVDRNFGRISARNFVPRFCLANSRTAGPSLLERSR